MDDPLNLTGKYILDENGEPVECVELIKWAMWYEKPENRHLYADKVGKRWSVSTIFTGIDVGYSAMLGKKHPPILFETMVFAPGLKDEDDQDGVSDRYCERYSTKAEAKEGHERILKLVKARYRRLVRN